MKKAGYKAENDAARGGGFGRFLTLAVGGSIDNDGDRDESTPPKRRRGLAAGLDEIT